MKLKTLALVAAAIVLPGCASTPPAVNEPVSTSPWLKANMAIVNEHVLPRYQQLADANAALAKQSEALCDAPSQASLDQARQAFHDSMDAWVGVQHLRFGPVELFNRYHRFQLWPDKHNTGNKQLRKLLTEQKTELLEAERFANSSVAVQGLSAMERLLYGKNTAVTSFAEADQASYLCQLNLAIARNLAKQSADILKDWQVSPPPFQFMVRDTEEMLDGSDVHLGERQDVTNGFFKNLSTQLQSVIDQKLLRPMGENSDRAKPRYLESWRSQRSLRNISLNILAMESLYDIGFAPMLDDPDLHLQIKQAFRKSSQASTAIAPPLYANLKKAPARPTQEYLLTSLRELQGLITGPLAQALDIPLGFNSLDGD